jgi:glutathione peroxidase
MLRRTVLTALTLLPFARAAAAQGAASGFHFDSIDGGQYDMDAWRGRPVLVVNTASLCGYTSQYDDLQALHEAYSERGLVVLAVPSNDFAQELGSNDEVAEFCEMNFNLTLPMTTITRVRGRSPHPFYAWLRETEGFVPRWNFNKVLLDGEGRVVESYGSNANPMGNRIRRQIEALLPA